MRQSLARRLRQVGNGDRRRSKCGEAQDRPVAWSAPAPLNSNAEIDAGDDYFPQLSTDGAGNWVAVWQSDDNLSGGIGDDLDVLFSRSIDAGLTWTEPAPLNANAASDLGDDRSPAVTTNSQGDWIALWYSWDSLGGVIGDDSDILFSRSTDAGQNWTTPAPLNGNAAIDSGGDAYPRLTTDPAGNWIAIWSSTDTLSGTIGEDYDILFSRSTDAGVTWADPLPLNTNAASDTGDDYCYGFSTDSAGNWVAVWHSSVSPEGGADYDIFFARGRIFDVTTLFTDSFEQGQWNGLWVEDSQNDWATATQRATDGSYSAEVDGSASNATITVAAPIDLTPYERAQLSFDWLIESGLDTGEYLALDYFNGSSWQEVAKLSGNVDTENVWHHEVLTVDGAYLVGNFQFRFRAKMSGSDEDANVDNVQLLGLGVAGPPNQLPVAGDDVATTTEDSAVTIAVLANDSDPDLDALQIESFAQGSHGAVVDNGDGTLRYTPQPNYFGSDSFTYTVTDGRGGTDTASVLVTITPVNDAPVAVDDAASTYQDTAVLIPLLANDSDVDSAFWIQSLGAPAHGTLVDHGNGTVTYTPTAGYLGGDSFGYIVTDGALSDNATVSITVQPGEVTLTYSNTSAKTIRDRSTTTSTIAVPSAMTIEDVNVQLNISHTRDQDLDVYLISPSGTRVELFTDVGGNGDHFSGTILDDAASTSITAGSAPFAGTYRPEGSLAAFNGQNAVGTWTLEIIDDQLLYSGTLNSWSITLTGSPMALTASASGTLGDAAVITQADAQRAVDQALLWWSSYAQQTPAAPIQVYVSDLPEGLLGLAWGQSLTLDATANGAGWWVDSTPWDHRELVGAAAERMDLLTAVSHEIGHLLGYVHSDDPLDVMASTLSVGTRRLPGLGELGRGGGWVRQGNRTDLSDQTDRTDLVDQSDPTDLADPLPIGQDRHLGSSDAVRRAQQHAQALVESTQLLADDLLDLLARIDR